MTSSDSIDVVFFDVRDTLGEVDRPGHLILYPSSLKMLDTLKNNIGYRIGVITNLPKEVTSEMGRKMLADAGITPFLDPDGIIINHDVGVDKPNPEIFIQAAKKMGVHIENCMFSGENISEVYGALKAGMKTAVLKPCPPGREFQPPPLERRPVTSTDSGRAFEAFFEHEHLLGERIFDSGGRISEELKKLVRHENGTVILVNSAEGVPKNLAEALGLYVYLTNNFADQAHFTAEEAAVELAVARGLDRETIEWFYAHHAQARAYFRCFDAAYKRTRAGDATDLPYAINDLTHCLDGFVTLFRHHAVRENDILYPSMGKYFNDTDDSLLMNLLSQIGPRDFAPYVGIVETMEGLLGISH